MSCGRHFVSPPRVLVLASNHCLSVWNKAERTSDWQNERMSDCLIGWMNEQPVCMTSYLWHRYAWPQSIATPLHGPSVRGIVGILGDVIYTTRPAQWHINHPDYHGNNNNCKTSRPRVAVCLLTMIRSDINSYITMLTNRPPPRSIMDSCFLVGTEKSRAQLHCKDNSQTTRRNSVMPFV